VLAEMGVVKYVEKEKLVVTLAYLKIITVIKRLDALVMDDKYK
jgi:hypothetical protein